MALLILLPAAAPARIVSPNFSSSFRMSVLGNIRTSYIIYIKFSKH